MSKWFIVSPIFDEITEYCYAESRDALSYMKDKADIVADLSGRSVKREEVESVLRSDPEVNFAFWDHGSDDKLWGSEDEAVITLENVGLLSGRETFTSACSFGKKGGVEAWKLNAKTVLCYKDVVYFTTDSLEEFCEAFNFPIKRRVDGFSWKECLEKTKQRMTELVDELVKAGKALAASCLRYDRDILVCYDAEPPESDCALRKIAVRVFGPRVGWSLGKSFPVSIALFFLGLGILLHDYLHALWQVGGYAEILSLQGGYFAVPILILGFLLAYYQIWVLLKRKMGIKIS